MIRVIIERRVRKGEDISPLLLKLRTAAMQSPGYITGESLLSTEDSSNVVVLSTWQTLENWKAWAKSEIRTRLSQQIEALLAEKPKVRAFRILPT